MFNLAKLVLASIRRPRTTELDVKKRRSLRAVMAAVVSGVSVAASAKLSLAQTAPAAAPVASDDVVGAEDAALLTQVYASRRKLATAIVPRSVVSVTVLGYTSAVDGGGATFVRASSEPRHPGKVQSADGAWWTQVEGDVDVRQFGAVGDWNDARRTGKDNADAIQAAIDFVSFHGGGDIRVGGASYMVARPLVLRNLCNLVGMSDLQGGGGALIATGSHVFQMPPVGGFQAVCFSLRHVSIIGGVRGRTDLLSIPAGGSWGWSTIESCYICNLRHIDMIVTGVHVFNNNFQNACRIQIRGADALFSGNYANYDDELNMYSEKDVFFQITAAGAFDFSHNYITSFGGAGTGPRVLDIQNSHQVRVVGNQLDGGDQYNVSVTAGSDQVIVTDNRILKYKNNVPILVSNVTDVLISSNYIQSLGPNDGFIRFESKLGRIAVRDNLTNDRKDDSIHDFVDCPMDSDVALSGPGLLVMHCTQDNVVIPSAGFERTYSNLGFTGPLQHFYVDSRYVKKGRYVTFARLDPERRMVVIERSTETMLYDSASNPVNRFRLICYVDGQFVVEA